MWKEEKEIVPFENKLWLSSPTMHGPELEYMTEAFQTNWMSTVGKNISEVEHLTCKKWAAVTQWLSLPERRRSTWR